LISASQKVSCRLSFERAHADENRLRNLAGQATTARRREVCASSFNAAHRRSRHVEADADRPGRVSTVDHNLALQRVALSEAGCGRIFTEQMSGAVADRPALHGALEFARSGDTLIVWKLDRLARSMKQLIETIEHLRVRGIGLRSLTAALDMTAQGPLVFHMFGALAEFERSMRTQAARRAGCTRGRPPKRTDDDIEASDAGQSRDPNRAPPRCVSRDALPVHPRRTNREYHRRLTKGGTEKTVCGKNWWS
jgi:hypothetical protein